MASGDRPDRLQRWNVLAIALLIFYLIGIGLFCYAALTTTPVRSPYAITSRAVDRLWRPPGLVAGRVATRPRFGRVRCLLLAAAARDAQLFPVDHRAASA